jgi:predicted nucleic acid-binding Zn ribbon protein
VTRPEDPDDRSGDDATGLDPERDEAAAEEVEPPADGVDAAEEPEPRPAEVEHEETGLDLARTIARSLAGTSRAPRRTSRPGARPGRRRDGAGTKASGAHPDERDPQLLDSTIGRLIAEQGWATDVRVHGVFSRWESLVGREVAAHCRPESFADGKLTVRTDSTAWATQVRLLAPTVVRRLNEELGDGTVTVVDVLGPHGPTWRKGPRSVRDGRGPRDTYG